ncbi:MAG: sortase [Roseiflexaceae bacterium]
MPSLDTQPAPKIVPARSAKKMADEDSFALLQALLEAPIAAGIERRGPVVLRSVDPRHDRKPRRPAAPTWFDTLLQRSSQVLLVGSMLVLGYWFVNVPLSNWLHSRRTPTVRASGMVPNAAATRIVPTQTTLPVANAAPTFERPDLHSTIKIAQQRASSVPSSASATAPRATEPLVVDQQIASPTLDAAVLPTAIPTQAAAPLTPSPTMTLFWPTITPVQLGTISKPSPVPILRAPVIAQPAAPARSRAGSVLPTRLIIPALGLDVRIKEVFIVGNQWQVAEYAAGYLNGSGLPGVPGNLAISGHAGLYGAVFASLGALNPADDIYIDAAGVRYHYRLRRSSAFWPNQADLLDSTETPTMTLITCTNWDTQRLVAQADYVDSGPALDG